MQDYFVQWMEKAQMKWSKSGQFLPPEFFTYLLTPIAPNGA